MRPGRTGVTLMEMLVAAAAALVLLLVCFGFWRSGGVQTRRVERQLDASQMVAELLLGLEDDLIHLLPGAPASSRSAPVLTFLRVKPVPAGQSVLDDGLTVRSERVTWEFDPRIGRVLRNGKPLGAGPFRAVTFRYQPVTGTEGATVTLEIEGSDPAPASAGRAVPSAFRRTFTRSLAVATAGDLATMWAGP